MSTSPGLTDNVGLPWKNAARDCYAKGVTATNEPLGHNAFGVKNPFPDYPRQLVPRNLGLWAMIPLG